MQNQNAANKWMQKSFGGNNKNHLWTGEGVLQLLQDGPGGDMRLGDSAVHPRFSSTDLHCWMVFKVIENMDSKTYLGRGKGSGAKVPREQGPRSQEDLGSESSFTSRHAL